jgi:hypothetical protein
MHPQTLISVQELPVHPKLRLQIPRKVATKLPSTNTPPITPVLILIYKALLYQLMENETLFGIYF